MNRKNATAFIGVSHGLCWENKEAGKAILAALSITRTKTEEKKKKKTKQNTVLM